MQENVNLKRLKVYKSNNKHYLIITSQGKSFGVLVQKYLSLNVEILPYVCVGFDSV